MMYYYWKTKGIRPSIFYQMSKGEQIVIRAFFEKELEEKNELIKQMEKSGFACPAMLNVFQAVIVSIRNFIPKGLRWLFPENTIERFIDDGMKWLNDYLDDGKINNSHNKLTEQVLKVKDEKIDKANQELRKNLINIRFQQGG